MRSGCCRRGRPTRHASNRFHRVAKPMTFSPQTAS
jgi:hypothetical protein